MRYLMKGDDQLGEVESHVLLSILVFSGEERRFSLCLRDARFIYGRAKA